MARYKRVTWPGIKGLPFAWGTAAVDPGDDRYHSLYSKHEDPEAI